jgi:sigma-B regulation protein RsbU (phosphoserine phosphatase)
MGQGFDAIGLDAASLLDALPDGAYVTDRDRRILFWNQAAESITGWRRGDVVSHCCRDNILCHLDKEGRPLCGQEHCPLHRAMVTDSQSETPLTVFAQTKDGRRIAVEVSVSPIHDAQGRVIGGVEVFRDHTYALEDLARAQAIQHMALQLDLPPDPRIRADVRYTPRDRVGGDFYRGEALDADRYVFLVADVRGHGLASALYAMQFRTLWDDARTVLDDPALFLTMLNRRVAMLDVGGHGYFATAIHVVVDARSGDFTCGVAGHPPPILLRGRHGCDHVAVQGPALGLVPDAPYQGVRGRLGLGDTLLLYTDAAIEASDDRRHELQEHGLAQLASRCNFTDGAAALQHLEESVLRFSNALALPDDLTLLSIHRPALQPRAGGGAGY